MGNYRGAEKLRKCELKTLATARRGIMGLFWMSLAAYSVDVVPSRRCMCWKKIGLLDGTRV